MKREAFVLKVRSDKLAEYKRHHQAVWPEMLQALRQHGWHNYSLFLRDDGLPFGYVETSDGLADALEGMSKEDVNRRWQDFMAPYFEALGGKHVDEGLLVLEEVFHLE